MNPQVTRVLLFLITLVICWVENRALAFGVPQRSVSSTRQFTIYCDDNGLRSAVVGFVEVVKTDILGLLGIADKWKYPVVIHISPERSSESGRTVSAVRIYETEVGFKVQLDVVLTGDLARAKFREQLARAILLEIAYRDKPAAVSENYLPEPPEWLIYGALEWIDSSKGETVADVFKTLLDAPRPPSLTEFLAQKTFASNSVSEDLYRACSLALVKLLVELPDGRSKLLGLLRNLPVEGEAVTLAKYFPELAGDSKKLEKWWMLSLARLSAGNRYLGLSFEETSRKLDALLLVRIPGKDEAFKLENFKEYLKLPQSRHVLSTLGAELLALAANASPLYRPVVAEYHQLTLLLAHGKTKGVSQRLSQLATDRERITERIHQISDYMNWFEATQMTTLSGAFESYLQTARTPKPVHYKRKDAISLYLDAVEAEFE